MIHGKPGASWPMDPTQECNVSLTLEKPVKATHDTTTAKEENHAIIS